MSKEAILLDWHDDVAVITLNRPDRRNAVNLDMLESMVNMQTEISERKARAVVLTGAPPAFCAGADLSGVREEVFHDALSAVLVGFTSLPCVVIAAVDGAALGAGAQLLAVCDVRVVTAGSIIGVPAAKLGLVVHHWTIDRLVREFSPPVARNMLLTASTYTGEQLHGVGAVHRIGNLDSALQWAKEISQLAQLTIRGHKVALESVSEMRNVDDIVVQLRDLAMASDDAREGREAFLAKRPPRFTGA
ncbi:MAG: enoyl-CoA hydratase-related protein [Ilumatobacteraceae bacterium]